MKQFRVIACTLSVLVCLTGCTKKPTMDAGAEPDQEETLVINDTHSDDGRMVVGISMPSQSLERWNRDGAFLKRQFEQEGCEVILSFGNDLIDHQIDGIYDMIERGADLLIISPIDASSLETVIHKAAEAAIPIISYDRLILRSPHVDYYVSFDNYNVGRLQGQYIIDALDLNHTVDKTFYMEFVSGDPADNNAKYFYNGAYDVLLPYIATGELSILSGQKEFYQTATTSWSRSFAQERFEGILNSYYINGRKLHAVCCANDTTAMGVMDAIQEDYKHHNQIVITGQDADEANLKRIMDGKQSMTVYKALHNESVVTIALGMEILNGEKPGEELISNSNWDFECEYDTRSYDNGKKIVNSYLLSPIVITKENIQEELIDKGIYEMDEQGYFHAVK